MPFAVTHVILTIVLLDVVKHKFFHPKWKRIFDVKLLFIAGISGLLPDIDYHEEKYKKIKEVLVCYLSSPSP